MLFGETVAVYCENYTEHTDTLCGQNAEFWYVKAGGTYTNHWALEGLIMLSVAENVYEYESNDWTIVNNELERVWKEEASV
jgi:hypothetical protein